MADPGSEEPQKDWESGDQPRQRPREGKQALGGDLYPEVSHGLIITRDT